MKYDEALITRLNEFLKENLKDHRLEHTYKVADEAVKLAEKYGVDKDTAYMAGLFHDMYRNLPNNAMNMYIRHLNIPERYCDNSNLAHSKIAAAVMKNNYNIEDEELLNAVSYHTTGRADMSLLEKIVFIADAIEPGRKYPGVDKIREAAYEDIDRACMISLEGTIKFLTSKEAYIDPDTIKALEYLKGAK